MFRPELVFKKASGKKVCPQTKHGEKASIWCPHLKAENQPLCLQQSAPLSNGLQKPPCLRWSLKLPVRIEFLCMCHSVAKFFIVFHLGFKSKQSRLQLNCRPRVERKGTAEMYTQIFLLCILQHYESNLRSKQHKSDCKVCSRDLKPPPPSHHLLDFITGGMEDQ